MIGKTNINMTIMMMRIPIKYIKLIKHTKLADETQTMGTIRLRIQCSISEGLKSGRPFKQIKGTSTSITQW
jgi:hypothetical protein